MRAQAWLRLLKQFLSRHRRIRTILLPIYNIWLCLYRELAARLPPSKSHDEIAKAAVLVPDDGTVFFFSAEEVSLQDRIVGDFRGYIKDRTPKSAEALEIGAGYNPILPKREGYAVRTIDHADQQALKKMYGDMGVDSSLIEPIDYIWTGERLPELLEHRTFETIVASHLIEHQPDPIGFLQDCSASLQSTGALFLVVPDLRFCFDYFKSRSDIAGMIAAHQRRATRHTFEAWYRNAINVSADVEGRPDTIVWSQEPLREVRFGARDPMTYYRSAFDNAAAADYMDTHAYYFTPCSFLIIMNEATYLGLLDLHVSLLTRARGYEFLAVLRPGKPTFPSLEAYLDMKRGLYLQMLEEDRERLGFAPRPKA
jgi:hypothetical protein